jgi:hypothetical protein
MSMRHGRDRAERPRSWWEETKHVLRRPGQKDKSYTITAVPLMVSRSHLYPPWHLSVLAVMQAFQTDAFARLALVGEITDGHQCDALVGVSRQVGWG